MQLIKTIRLITAKLFLKAVSGGNHRTTAAIGVTAFVTLSSTSASAQLFYAPSGSATAIPTMGSYALILLSVLLAATALFKGKFKKQGVNSFVALCMLGTLISGVGGVSMINQANADGDDGDSGTLGLIDSPTGGSVLITNGVLNIFENTSGVPQRIEDIIADAACSTVGGPIDGAPQCEVGDTVSTGSSGMCYVDCRALVD